MSNIAIHANESSVKNRDAVVVCYSTKTGEQNWAKAFGGSRHDEFVGFLELVKC